MSHTVSLSFGGLLGSILRPVCPICGARILFAGIARGLSGYDFHTFRCEDAHAARVVDDPLPSRTQGWLAGELRPPV